MRDIRFVRHVAAAVMGASLLFSGMVAGVSSIVPTVAAEDGQPGEPAFTDVDFLNFRALPSLSGSIIATLPYNTYIRILGDSVTADGYDWYEAQLSDGTTGYLVRGFVRGSAPSNPTTPTPPAPATDGFVYGDSVVVSTDLLNVRSLPSISASVLTVYGSGTVAVVTGDATVADGYTWYPVDNYGWVAGQYLVANSDSGSTPTTPDDEIINLTVTADVLNVRSGPSLDSAIVGTRSFHDLVTFHNRATAADGSTWTAINAEETQWVSSRYVNLHPDPNAPPL